MAVIQRCTKHTFISEALSVVCRVTDVRHVVRRPKRVLGAAIAPGGLVARGRLPGSVTAVAPGRLVARGRLLGLVARQWRVLSDL